MEKEIEAVESAAGVTEEPAEPTPRPGRQSSAAQIAQAVAKAKKDGTVKARTSAELIAMNIAQHQQNAAAAQQASPAQSPNTSTFSDANSSVFSDGYNLIGDASKEIQLLFYKSREGYSIVGDLDSSEILNSTDDPKATPALAPAPVPVPVPVPPQTSVVAAPPSDAGQRPARMSSGTKKRRFRPWKWVKRRVWRKRADRLNPVAQQLERRLSQRPDPQAIVAAGIMNQADAPPQGALPAIMVEEGDDIEGGGGGPTGEAPNLAAIGKQLSLAKNINQLPERRNTEDQGRPASTVTVRSILINQMSERKTKRKLTWYEFVDVYETFDPNTYDRTANKPWACLSTRDKIFIKSELNQFKREEMEVHPDSARFTRFHP